MRRLYAGVKEVNVAISVAQAEDATSSSAQMALATHDDGRRHHSVPNAANPIEQVASPKELKQSRLMKQSTRKRVQGSRTAFIRHVDADTDDDNDDDNNDVDDDDDDTAIVNDGDSTIACDDFVPEERYRPPKEAYS